MLFRGRRTTAWAALCALAAPLAVITAVAPARAAVAGAGPKLVRIGTAPVLPAGTQPLAGAASAQKLRVSVALAPRNARALSAYANAVENPQSPDYRHFLKPSGFAARFGPRTDTIAAVKTVLTQAGLRPGPLSANHLSLDVVADAGVLEKGLHLTLARILLPSRRPALVNLQAPALPASVAGDVQAIIGLDGLQTMRTSLVHQSARKASLNSQSATPTPHVKQHQTPKACSAASSAASQQSAYTANQIASAYRFDGLYSAGDEGAGVSVGVYELEPDAPSDISAYQSCYGTDTPITYQRVDGGAGSGPGSGEAAFDIEQLIGLAPKANLIVYQGPNSNSDDPGSGPYDIFAQMISQDRVSIITNSWGECEAQEGATDAHAENTLFEEAAIQGQSVLSAAGDDGSEDCYGATAEPDVALAVDDPGSQPFVTDVGGTSMTALGPAPTELAWNSGGNALDDIGAGPGAGGGGISSLWPMPAYQSGAPAGLNVVNANSSAQPCGVSGDECREVPDVAADADPAHGYLIYYNGARTEGGEPSGWQGTGGTSGAAPLWAAAFALADADSACAGTAVGFANPALYRAAAAGEGTSFNDVTSGNNDFSGTNGGQYPAAGGYDMATGLGSPDVAALAPKLCQGSLRLSVPASFQSFTEAPTTLSVKTFDSPGDAVTTRVSGLPRGVRFNPGTDVISGNPRAAGSYDVKVSALDGSDAVRSASFVWKVAERPRVSHLSLSGVHANRTVLSLRLNAGTDEALPSLMTITLPAGLSLVGKGSALAVTALAGDKTIRRSVGGSGRHVTITLKSMASPIVVRFGAGSLRASASLRRAAMAWRKSPRVVWVVVRDQAGATSTARGSVRVTT